MSYKGARGRLAKQLLYILHFSTFYFYRSTLSCVMLYLCPKKFDGNRSFVSPCMPNHPAPLPKKVRYPLDGVFYECRKCHYFSNSRAYNFSLIISLINKYDQYGNAKTTSIRYLRCQKNANKRFTFTDIILTMMTMN